MVEHISVVIVKCLSLFLLSSALVVPLTIE